MEIRIGQTRVYFSFYFFVALVLFLLIDKTGLVVYILLAIALHEMAHILAMYCTRVKVGLLKFTPFGLKLERSQGSIVSCGTEVIISLSGSFANLVLGQVFFLLPPTTPILLFAAVNTALGLMNLLPIMGLDGGNIVTEVLEYCFGPSGRTAALYVSKFFTVCLFLMAFYFWYQGTLNLSLIGLCIYLTILLFRRA